MKSINSVIQGVIALILAVLVVLVPVAMPFFWAYLVYTLTNSGVWGFVAFFVAFIWSLFDYGD